MADSFGASISLSVAQRGSMSHQVATAMTQSRRAALAKNLGKRMRALAKFATVKCRHAMNNSIEAHPVAPRLSVSIPSQ